jgi:hypothetical protein
VEDQNARAKIVQNIDSAYRKAPHFIEIYPFLLEIMNFGSNNVSDFNTNLIRCLAGCLEIECQILLSSELDKDNSLKGENRIIEINRCLGSSHYVNPIGGIPLYEKQHFTECGLKLSFLQPEDIHYPQLKKPFVPFLSIIDVLMFNGVSGTSKLLTKYHLIKHEDSKDG